MCTFIESHSQLRTRQDDKNSSFQLHSSISEASAITFPEKLSHDQNYAAIKNQDSHEDGLCNL
jgi:hypothetical protein